MIDWDRVAELREEVGHEEFADVVDIFVEEVEEVTRRLTAAPRPASLEEDLHFLKGSALNLGFRRFAALCEEGERLAASGRAEDVEIAAILLCYDESRDAFLAGIGKRWAS